MKTTWPNAIVGLLCTSSVLAQTPSVAPVPCGNDCVHTEALKPRFFPDLQSGRVLAKYGPLAVPSMNQNHGMRSYQLEIPAPCDDCTITHAVADVEFANGAYANANTSMWLHHLVVANSNRTSVTCNGVPEFAFVSGNERTPMSISVGGTKRAGYPIKKGERFFLIAELMNEARSAKDVLVKIDWEFVKSPPADFKAVTPVWLDVDGPCLPRNGEVPLPENATVFNLVMNPPWKANFSGEVLWVIPHLHDGGDSLKVMKNNAVTCDSLPGYGETPGFRTPEVEHGHHGRTAKRHEEMLHISSMTVCDKIQRIEVGDTWGVKADYNLTKHAPQGEGDHLAPVMGIAVLFVVRD
ncbi:hypothetical protein B0T25DRAFT_254938 [Lasiosphaeria hispida]|uniref:Uncharacterized protein n=1 Tax=Lasiosphaeria hispida TaxID=260671 RepID=A0AAJ0HFS9_9PEZI|nr:hypothetical protein B0T25DRAFT_254938 [Lasiosphaeria hispida]